MSYLNSVVAVGGGVELVKGDDEKTIDGCFEGSLTLIRIEEEGWIMDEDIDDLFSSGEADMSKASSSSSSSSSSLSPVTFLSSSSSSSS